MKDRLSLIVLVVLALSMATSALAQPGLSFDPKFIETPSLYTGEMYAEYVYFRNKGDEKLHVTLKEEEPVAWMWMNKTELEILPNEEVPVLVSFIARTVPCMDGAYKNKILISSDDPLNPYDEVGVTIETIASQYMYPVDNLIWFGFVTGPDMELVRLMNSGCQHPLTITGITTSDPVFWLPLLKFPIVVQPLEEFRFYLQFVAPPYQYGTYLGTMTVTSDDPARPVVEIPIEAFYVPGGPLKSEAAVKESTWGAIKALYR